MYSRYCIEKCPIGKPQSDKFLSENNSGIDAALDMQTFVDKCACQYEKERRIYNVNASMKKLAKALSNDSSAVVRMGTALKNYISEVNMKHYEKVNHPAHYNDGKIEVIDFIEDQKLGFSTGNAVKYISRAGKKPNSRPEEDLAKAAWYINREIQRITGKDPNAAIRNDTAIRFAQAIESRLAYDGQEDPITVKAVLELCTDILAEEFGLTGDADNEDSEDT